LRGGAFARTQVAEYPKSNASANSAIPACAILTEVRVPLVSFEMDMHRMTKMPKRGSRFIALLLLSVMPAMALADHESYPTVAAGANPAGCHQLGSTKDGRTENSATEHAAMKHAAKEHVPIAPDSRPVSYRCCQTGHNSAVVEASQTSPASLAFVLRGDFRPAPSLLSTRNRSGNLLTPSADPPCSTPLRV
jgi:hypothetical protein